MSLGDSLRSAPAVPPVVAAARRRDAYRRQLLGLGLALLVLAVLHHADHVIRGDVVVEQGLPAAWNHSGWPFQDAVTPFTASLLVYALILPGIAMNVAGRLAARWWATSAVVLLLVVGFVHFAPTDERESPSVILDTHAAGGDRLFGPLAVADLLLLVLALLAVLVVATRAARDDGRPDLPPL